MTLLSRAFPPRKQGAGIVTQKETALRRNAGLSMQPKFAMLTEPGGHTKIPEAPRVDIVSAPVVGQRFGVLGGVRDIEQGETESFVPADESFLRRGNMVFGHEVVEYITVVGTSSAGSFSIGGYGTDGNGAQGGAF